MAVNEIDPSSSLGTGGVNEGSKLRNQSVNKESTETVEGTKDSKDTVEVSELARFTQLTLSDAVSTPNESNIAAIQQAIEDGNYDTDAVIDETADKIADSLI